MKSLKTVLKDLRGVQCHTHFGNFDLRTQVTFGGHGFVVTRLSSGIRVGGAVELGGLELPANANSPGRGAPGLPGARAAGRPGPCR